MMGTEVQRILDRNKVRGGQEGKRKAESTRKCREKNIKKDEKQKTKKRKQERIEVKTENDRKRDS